MRRFYGFLVILLLGILSAGCRSGQADLEQAIAELEGPHTEVTIQNLDRGPDVANVGEFSPPNVIVPPGATVVWISDDTAPHSVTEGTPEDPDPLFDYEIPPGSYGMFTFPEPGLYTYFCRYHEQEAGEVLVVEVTPDVDADSQ